MKIRNGFISNSSTSSFILFTPDEQITKEQIESITYDKDVINFIYENIEKISKEAAKSLGEYISCGEWYDGDKNAYKILQDCINNKWNIFQVIAESNSDYEPESILSGRDIYCNRKDLKVISILMAF